MQINPKLIKKQFEKSFNSYNQNAIVQRLMAEKLVKNLSLIKTDFNSILELGCGTGILTKEIVKAIKFKTYSANDLVEKSKKYVSEIVPNVQFYCGNALKVKTPKSDLIISNAMFQWFNKLENICFHCKKQLNSDGILAFSTFSDKNFKEIKNLTGLSLDYKTFDEIKNVVSKEFEILYAEEFDHILSFNTPLELLAHMKNTGVNSLTTQHWTFKEVKEFCDKYKKEFPQITLTYSPVIIIGKTISTSL